MAHPSQEELQQHKTRGFHWGTVVSKPGECANRTGCVRVAVSGMTSETGIWAFPAGLGSGGAEASTGMRGFHHTPPKGAQVLVGFVHGESAEAFYFLAQAPANQLLTDVKAAASPTVVDKLFCIETEQFKITIDDDAQTLKIGNKTGDCYIEIDSKKGIIETKSRTQVNTESGGLVDIRGMMVQLQQRIVSKLGAKQIV